MEQTPPDPHSITPHTSTKFIKPPPTTKKIPGYTTEWNPVTILKDYTIIMAILFI
jgi:hypothetical protein